MSKKFVLLNVILVSSFAIAMNQEEQKSDVQIPKVDLTALKESPVRAASMPSPHCTDSPATHSPRSGANSPRAVQRFLSQQALASHEKMGEGSHRAVQKLMESKAKLVALQGGANGRKEEIRKITDTLKMLADKCLALERSHADDQQLISEASNALTDAMHFLHIATKPNKVNSQPLLRASPSRVSFALAAAPSASSSVAVSSSVATASAKEDEKRECADDQKSASSDMDSDTDGEQETTTN